MRIRLSKPTESRTECRIVDIGPVRLFFSYETLVGVDDNRDIMLRSDNEWGSTTGKHLRQMGIKDWPQTASHEVEYYAEQALKQFFLRQYLEETKERMISEHDSQRSDRISV